MKKFSIAFAILALLTVSSCKKIYTCDCTTNIGGFVSESSTTNTQKKTKKDAKEDCEGSNGSTSFFGITTTIDCKLK